MHDRRAGLFFSFNIRRISFIGFFLFIRQVVIRRCGVDILNRLFFSPIFRSLIRQVIVTCIIRFQFCNIRLAGILIL